MLFALLAISRAAASAFMLSAISRFIRIPTS
jgi:hypothetical protein